MVRKKTIKAWQVVRYIEPHHGRKFCAACHGHLEEVCLMLTCLRGSWHQNWHRINSLISLSNYSVNSINHFHVWIIFPIKTQKKQVWKNCKQHDTVFKHKGTNLLFSQWQKTDTVKTGLLSWPPSVTLQLTFLWDGKCKQYLLFSPIQFLILLLHVSLQWCLLFPVRLRLCSCKVKYMPNTFPSPSICFFLSLLAIKL